MKPAISVVMPVYNVEKYVAGAIGSVLDQTFSDFELIIVDDGGQDGSVDICRQFDDPRIRIVSQANRGLAGARNTGIRESVGDLVALIDSDDLWRPRKLEALVDLMNANPLVGVAYTASELIDEDGRPIGVQQSPKIANVTAADVFLRNPVGNGSAPMLRREALADLARASRGQQTGEWFDESFRQSEDIECWMRIALTTLWRFAGVSEPLTLYRINEGGLSASVIRQLEAWERVASKVEAIDPEFAERWTPSARAFQLRYLARRAVRMRDQGLALALMRAALQSSAPALAREPVKTSTTLGAAIALRVMPNAVYDRLENGLLRARRAA